jgi:hypothetical protein
LEEIGPMMVNVMDFFNKTLGITRTNNIHLFKVDGGMEYAMSTLMLETVHLKGFMEQLHMSWDILGSNTFCFNESKHPWMRDLQPMFQI